MQKEKAGVEKDRRQALNLMFNLWCLWNRLTVQYAVRYMGPELLRENCAKNANF